MSGACPTPAPDDPMVRGLLRLVDCNVGSLVHQGYSTLFEPSGAIAGLLTTLLTLYIAFLGFGLMTGRARLQVGDLAVTAIKLGVVLALATQWSTYQSLVFDLLFRGPEQIADLILKGSDGGAGQGGAQVFDRLQADLDTLNGYAALYAQRAPAQTSPMLGGAGFGAFALNAAYGVLMLSTLGLLLAAKIVLGLLLATGPLFIALLLFDATRGVLVGWLRASLTFALIPLAVTVLLGISLTMLEPQLQQMADLVARNDFSLAPVYSIFTLVLVFAAVSIGAVIAGALIATGLKLPEPRVRSGETGRDTQRPAADPVIAGTRANRIAMSLDRADSVVQRRLSMRTIAGGGDARGSEASSDRRTLLTGRASPPPQAALEPRLGEARRRVVRPRNVRASAGRGR